VESKLNTYLTEAIILLAVLLALFLLWLFAKRINPPNAKEFKEITALEKSLKNQPK
jgi:predicted permease